MPTVGYIVSPAVLYMTYRIDLIGWKKDTTIAFVELEQIMH